MENRSGLAVDCIVTPATGTADGPRPATREAALKMLAEAPQAKTVGADKGYDVAGFVAACGPRPAPREQGVTPLVAALVFVLHVAQNLKHSGGSATGWPRAIDGRTTRHAGYALSQTIRKRIENLFGDGKQHRGLIRQLKVRRLRKASFVFAP